MKWYWALKDTVRYSLLVALISTLGVTATLLGIGYARATMELSAVTQRVCRAELSALRARNQFADRYLCPADPCLCLRVLAQGDAR